MPVRRTTKRQHCGQEGRRGLDEFRQRVGGGGLFLAWSGADASEQVLTENTGATIRCIVDADLSAATCLVTGTPAKHAVLVGRAH